MFPGDYCLATMTDYELTNLARIPLLMLEYAEQSGMDRDELLRLASITPANLVDPDTRLPMSAMLRLWRAILKRQEGTAIGVRIGSTCRATRSGLVGYAMYYRPGRSRSIPRNRQLAQDRHGDCMTNPERAASHYQILEALQYRGDCASTPQQRK